MRRAEPAGEATRDGAVERQEPIGAVGPHPPEPARRARRSIEGRVRPVRAVQAGQRVEPGGRLLDIERIDELGERAAALAEVLEHEDEPLGAGIVVEPVHLRHLDVEGRADVAVEADLVTAQVGEVAEQPDRGGRGRHLDEHGLGHAVTAQPQSHPVGGALRALDDVDLGDPTAEQRSEVGRIEVVHPGRYAGRDASPGRRPGAPLAGEQPTDGGGGRGACRPRATLGPARRFVDGDASAPSASGVRSRHPHTPACSRGRSVPRRVRNAGTRAVRSPTGRRPPADQVPAWARSRATGSSRRRGGHVGDGSVEADEQLALEVVGQAPVARVVARVDGLARVLVEVEQDRSPGTGSSGG